MRFLIIAALLLALTQTGRADTIQVGGDQITVDSQSGRISVTLPGAAPLAFESNEEVNKLVMLSDMPTGTCLTLGTGSDRRRLTVTLTGSGGQVEVRQSDGVILAALVLNPSQLQKFKRVMLEARTRAGP